MEYNWSLFSNSNSNNNSSNSTRGHNGNFIPNHAWDSSSSSPSPWDLPNYYFSPPPPPPPAAFQSAIDGGGNSNSSSSAIASAAIFCNYPDPHLTCLKLGKRHYFGDPSPPPPPPIAAMRRGKGGGSAAAAAPPPRCQVEGCEAALGNGKDYHRRHKVCEMHAKASKVALGGIEQRFCQQCSRFHAMGEFDEAKRSCRRRLAGHNERRRKSSQDHTCFARKQYHDIKMVGAAAGRQPQPHLANNSGFALSLLSPASYASPAPDLPARCSAALRELIAENRASQIANNCKIAPGWPGPENRGHVTLNLMQGPNSAFGLISGRPSEEDGGGDCSELWKLPLGY